jgi:hypothetical protein
LKESNYAWPVTAVSKNVYDCFSNAIKLNMGKIKNKKVVIFGAGIRGTLFSIMMHSHGIENFIFTDNNEEKWGGYINTYPIVSIEKALENKEDILIFITVENGVDIKKQLIMLGFIEDENFLLLDTNLYDIYMKQFNRKEIIDILVMGDCGLTHISLLDSQKSNLGKMLEDKLSDFTSKVLAMHGMGMRAFYNILCAQIYMDIKPKYLILPVNFDTFTGKHHCLPRTQHAELIKRIAEASKFNSEEMDDYVKLTEERSKSFHIEFSSKTSTKDNQSDLLNALYMKMNYMYKLKSDNEGVRYLMKILDLVKEQNILPILFIPPVNYMRGEQYFGQKFYEAYGANCTSLKNMLQQKNVDIMDLSYILTDSEFSDISTVDETANYFGRIQICNEITNYFNDIVKINKEKVQ